MNALKAILRLFSVLGTCCSALFMRQFAPVLLPGLWRSGTAAVRPRVVVDILQ